MSVELVQFMSQLLNLMLLQIFTHVKIAEKNAVDREDISFYAEFTSLKLIYLQTNILLFLTFPVFSYFFLFRLSRSLRLNQASIDGTLSHA